MHYEYSRAPQTPLPQMVEELMDVWCQMCKQDATLATRTFWSSDSAGGGLSLLTVRQLIDRNLPVPCGLINLSPYGNLADRNSSKTDNKANETPKQEQGKARGEWYRNAIVGGQSVIDRMPNRTVDWANPLLSPCNQSFERFPSMVTIAGTGESLMSDAVTINERATKAGVDSELSLSQHMMHVFPLFHQCGIPEVDKALDVIGKWIEGHS